MNALIKKVAGLLPDLETRGAVYLFAFVEREDVNRWDVVISSAWSDKDRAEAVRFVARLLTARLEPQEMTMLSHIAVVPSSDPNMLEVPQSLENVSPEDEKVVHVTFMRSDVRRAFIFKSQRPPAALSAASPAAVGAASN